MTRRSTVFFASIALAWTTAAAGDPAPRANAAPVSDAQSHFRRGVEFYDEGDLAAALAEMKRAYRIAPTFRVLYDIGQIQYELQNYAAAVAAFEGYLAGGKEVPLERRRQVERDVAKLKERLAAIDVIVNVPKAEIWIDDELVGAAPLSGSVVVNAGRRKVLVVKTGYVSAQRLVELAGGDTSRIAIELVEERPAALVPLPLPAPPPEPKKQEPAPAKALVVPAPERRASSHMWIGWTATSLLGLGSGALAYLAWRASVDLKEERTHLGTTGDALKEKSVQVRNLALAADLGFLATAMTAGASLVWTLSSSAKLPPDAPRIEVGLTPSTVRVGGVF